ncbi:hypothetical protein [Sinimarinibacterium thermocellulolyticum]|uniref:Uncharacterized protein n=1 Tax=Sinimarinibacterium thermocellulolyticum TaxID=3170016 RepID=A0ABV2AD10_9GAMM
MTFFGRHLRRYPVLLGLALTFAHGALYAQPVQVADDPRAAVAEFLPSCGPRFEEVDRRVAQAGAGDASYLRVNGFPYLRTDRLMSSYDRELDDPRVLEAWLLQLRDNDAFARDIELRNLGLDTSERSTLLLDMRLCAVWLSFMDASDPQRLRALIRAVRESAQAAAPANTHGSPAPAPMRGDATVQVFRSAREAEATALLERFASLPRDPLQRTGLTVDGWRALAAEFAPTWAITGAAGRNAPAALVWDGDRLSADPSTPTVYFLPAFARAGDTVLMQFHYFVWFARHDDAIDGVILRVTLDPQGRPLLYDSLGADGRGYRIHPARALEARSASIAESGVIADEVVGLGPVRVELDADTAGVIAVSADGTTPSSVAAAPREYTLAAYEDLLTLPRGGGTMSVFDARGHLRDADGGAARQLGHHAPLAPLQLRFDDPRLVEAHVLLPPDIEPSRVAGARFR